ncbi:MAG: dihydrofolate reductase family protein [Clostridia bacterium]
MTRVLYDVSMSLDGYVAGRHQSLREPLGVGGRRLHEWMLALAATRQQRNWREERPLPVGHRSRRKWGPRARLSWGATCLAGGWPVGSGTMGRVVGEEPPFHLPVFVLTHYPRWPLPLRGTTFICVTDGLESALEQARRAARGRDVAIAGGGCVTAQYLRAGLVDWIQIHLVPVLLGSAGSGCLI